MPGGGGGAGGTAGELIAGNGGEEMIPVLPCRMFFYACFISDVGHLAA